MMKLTIEPTKEFFMCGEVMVRMWQGTTETGKHIVALVAGVSGGDRGFELARTLVSIPPPAADEARSWAAEGLSKRYDPKDGP